MLAHDFNNLLTSILGYASLARATLPEEHSVVPLIENIENAGERSAELVRLMLATAGYRPRFRERLRVDEILAQILDHQPVPTHIHLTSTVEVEGFAGDERSIETLVCSLLSNAIESYGERAARCPFPSFPGRLRIQNREILRRARSRKRSASESSWKTTAAESSPPFSQKPSIRSSAPNSRGGDWACPQSAELCGLIQEGSGSGQSRVKERASKCGCP